ncbi:MAG: 2-amino-4-hydroxy-6-hydroxymethyldihydropteridine diphosphokinase [Endomicrobium sp.]|jgi:2-amino-4-hydroxy-6-hydroxymethyldihydropteridine diphosphokinase|nr:2-amino-4-hydroxy-6-hydroxymethyldihydropteridine diphosphokinase [Endomicrobium sp.]
MKNVLYLGLGSNIGNRVGNIIFALSFLQSSLFVDIKEISSFYKTSPVGGPKQRSFYNVVIKAYTSLNCDDLLLFLKQVEYYIFKRKKTMKWGPRRIDIDILFFGKKVVNRINLVIPHKEILNRLFILIPLNEIACQFEHPVFKRKIGDILSENLLILKHQKVKIIQVL